MPSIFREQPSHDNDVRKSSENIASPQKGGKTMEDFHIIKAENGAHGVGDDRELLVEEDCYDDPDDNYVRFLGFKFPKLWRLLWASGDEDKKIRRGTFRG